MSKWPKKVKHRNKVFAKIYRPCAGRESYRIVWYAAGKRQMKSLPNYSGPGGAKEFADKLAPELAKQTQATMLTPGQANDALAAFEHLYAFQRDTGQSVSLLAAVSEYCQLKRKIGTRNTNEVADGFLKNVATVKREELSKAVEEFLAGEEHRTKSHNGQRSQIAAKYHHVRARYLRRFANTFSSYGVSDLAKHDVDSFFTSKLLADMSPKSRNHHRAAIAQFLSWCVRKDYLNANHRLLEADQMRREETNGAEIQLYTAKEFRLLLDNADDTMRAIVAIGGLAGLRVQEILRLDWEDVWRVKGYIEVTAGKSKTRQRRLVEVGDSLSKWLSPFRRVTAGLLWTQTESVFQKAFSDLADQ
ncbi:MAG: site-specific integrase, partial [Verrucomicrobiota bacterium]